VSNQEQEEGEICASRCCTSDMIAVTSVKLSAQMPESVINQLIMWDSVPDEEAERCHGIIDAAVPELKGAQFCCFAQSYKELILVLAPAKLHNMTGMCEYFHIASSRNIYKVSVRIPYDVTLASVLEQDDTFVVENETKTASVLFMA